MTSNENNFDLDGEIIYIGMPVSPSVKFSYRIIVLRFFAGRFLTDGRFMLINQNMTLIQGFALKDRVQINFQINDRRKEATKEREIDWWQNKEILNISKL